MDIRDYNWVQAAKSEAMNKQWRRDEYKDKLTGELLAIEILPVNGARRHKEGEGADECDCIPALKQFKWLCFSVPMLVHNAFDGREFNEADYEATEH